MAGSRLAVCFQEIATTAGLQTRQPGAHRSRAACVQFAARRLLCSANVPAPARITASARPLQVPGSFALADSAPNAVLP